MRADGICHSIVEHGAEITLPDAEENTRLVASITQGNKPPILVDIRDILSITKEARDHFSMKNREPGVIAIALLIKSPVSRVIGNFYLGISRPRVPTRLFTSEAQAVNWLKTYINRHVPK
jgi:hypothetical protein